MAKKKFIVMVKLNTLEILIEYTLISSKLNIISEMIKTPLEYPRNPTLLNPLKKLLEIRTWGSKWKKKINKTNEWPTWQWVNAKIDKKILHCSNKL